ncbi:hypothetical protein CH063_01749 [Colletotrichum higginsianum]|uniref:Uncharacterized protein n=1 Tax=Colletotrichum higginsianum (strain IMI 349063) TaxID=759273 RepID=H1VBT4_COLHI|nr:hypothetical protein CH063_01749 [Colletotrichum higginsianum]
MALSSGQQYRREVMKSSRDSAVQQRKETDIKRDCGPHSMEAFGQAPSLHRRSTFIRYQFELTRIQIVSRWICYLGQLQYLPQSYCHWTPC